MSFKHPHILYWSLSVLCSLLTVFALFNFQKPDGRKTDLLKPINVTTALKIIPGRYYQMEGQFYLDMNGTNKMVLPIQNLPDNIGAYNLLVINNLAGYQTANFYLTAQITTNQKESPFVYKQKLIGNRQSINQLNLEWLQAGTINDVAFVIESNDSLGFDSSFDNQISWQSIQFTDPKQINPVQQFASEVFAFVPLNYSSVNVNNGEVIAIYKPMLIGLGVWLFITIILFLIIKPSTRHLYISIAISWFFATVVYGHNFTQQAQFNQIRFADNGAHLNEIDRRLSAMANQINETLIQQDKTATAKILIVGGDDFNKKRLNFHLLQHNVGIVDDFELLLNKLAPKNNYAVLLPPYNNVCEKNQQQSTTKSYTILFKSNRFCLIQ